MSRRQHRRKKVNRIRRSRAAAARRRRNGSHPAKPMPVIPPRVRRERYFTVEEGGAMAGWGRSRSYDAVDNGLMPVDRFGKLLLVPKEKWLRQLRRMLRGGQPLPRIPDPRSQHKIVVRVRPAPARRRRSAGHLAAGP